VRPAVRFLTVVLVAGAGLALGVILLAPEVRAFIEAGRAGEGESLLELEELSQRSLVLDRDGNVMAVLHAEENRSPVALERVPQHVVDAILDVEDDQYWHHGGVNLRSTLRALVTNVQSGEVRQGGSTITQQLVKNALLTPEKSIDRKVKEAVLAVRLEDRLSKREILERYLNTVYFGNGVYGVQAAAERYWGKDVEELSVADAALLAGVIRNPVGYDPIRFPEAARARRDMALERMVANGHMPPGRLAELRETPLPSALVTPAPPPNDYFVEEVKQRLLDDERLGDTGQERYNAVFKGGLRIHTTFDPRMQRAAQDAVKEKLPNTNGRFAAALASVEPGTGAVRAIVAGDDFNAEKYNLATQGRRQPGSSFKTFVLLAALEEGYSPNDTINGQDGCVLKIPGFAPYKPGNYSEGSGGVMTLAEATARSVNCAYARLGAHIGLEKVADMAGRLGIPRELVDVVPSISLGAEEATPLEMAAAYAAIANDGVYHAPRFVEKVLDRNDRVVFEGGDEGTRVLSEQTARVATQVLRRVVEGGTGTRARLRGRQVAGKTGTSQEWQNAWFVGYTPQLSTAVWMGSPEGNITMRVGPCGRVTGGCIPAMIWNVFMSRALEGTEPVPFAEPTERIRRGRYIRDSYSTTAPQPSTTTTSTTSTTWFEPFPTTAPWEATTTTLPPRTTTTTTPKTTTTAPPRTTTTTTTAPDQEKPSKP
jgi:1A family penicillin-binding protein